VTYDQIPEPIRYVLGCFEGMRRVGFRSEDIYCEPARSPGLPDGQLTVFALLKTQGKEFRIECGSWPDSDVAGLEEHWRATCAAVNSGELSQTDLDRIWQEGPVYRQAVEFMLALDAKGIRPPESAPS
jgi:hypothetical protein